MDAVLNKSLYNSGILSAETPGQSRDPITTRWERTLPRKLSPICPEMTNEEASRVASKISGLWTEGCLSQEQRRLMEPHTPHHQQSDAFPTSREQPLQMQRVIRVPAIQRTPRWQYPTHSPGMTASLVLIPRTTGAGLEAEQLAQGKQMSHPHQPGPVSTNPGICTSAIDKKLESDLILKGCKSEAEIKAKRGSAKNWETKWVSHTNSNGRSYWPPFRFISPWIKWNLKSETHLLILFSYKSQLGLACSQVHTEKP